MGGIEGGGELVDVGAGRDVSSEEAERDVRRITEELANSRLDSRTILATLTRALSHARRGTFVAIVMNADPSTSQVVAADSSDPMMARWVERYLNGLRLQGRVSTGGVSGRVVDTGKPVLMPSVSLAQFLQNLPPEGVEMLRSQDPPVPLEGAALGVVIVPMQARGAVIGTLGLFELDGPRPLEDEDQAWLQSIADRAALLIDAAESHAAAARRLDRLTAAHRIAEAVAANADARQTLHVILDQLTARLGVDAADLFLLDAQQEELILADHVGFGSTVPDYKLELDDELLGSPPGNPASLVLSDLNAPHLTARRSLLAREGFQDYRAIRLVSGERVVGLLEVFQRTPLETDQEWRDFFELTALLAAAAVDRSQAAEVMNAPREVSGPRFSRVETEVLRLMMEGRSNRGIALTIHLSESTIKFHVGRMLRKAGALNRTQLVRKATQGGWLEAGN